VPQRFANLLETLLETFIEKTTTRDGFVVVGFFVFKKNRRGLAIEQFRPVKMADKKEGGAVTVELVADYIQHDIPDRLVEAFHFQIRLPPRISKSRPPGRLFDHFQTVSHPLSYLAKQKWLPEPIEKSETISRWSSSFPYGEATLVPPPPELRSTGDEAYHPGMKTLLILGSAHCLKQDTEAVLRLVDDFDVLAINDAGVVTDIPVKYWVSQHPEGFFVPLHGRSYVWDAMGMGAKTISFYRPPCGRVDMIVNVDHRGTSGLYAIRVGKRLGYKKIVLCGVPLTKTGYSAGLPRRTFNEPDRVWKIWEDEFKSGKLSGVSSMSGWTAELLGRP
jgi:hypothetical protein